MKKNLMALVGAGLIVGASCLGARGQSTNVVKTINTNLTTTLNWQEQSLLNVQRSLPDGYVDNAFTNGWYNTNVVGTLTATPSNSAAKVFSGWQGDIVSTNNPLTFTMTSPITNEFPVFNTRNYTWTISSQYTNQDSLVISPGTTNYPYGTVATQNVNKTIINIGPGKRAVYVGESTQ